MRRSRTAATRLVQISSFLSPEKILSWRCTQTRRPRRLEAVRSSFDLDTLGRTGAADLMLHCCPHDTHRQIILTVPRWSFMSTRAVQTELAAHSGHGIL